jgi:hypothetical protein
MTEPTNAMVEEISSIITSVLFEEMTVRFETSVGFEDRKLPSNDILLFILSNLFSPAITSLQTDSEFVITILFIFLRIS